MQMRTEQSKIAPSMEWMDLKTIQQYACVSERTIREWIHRPHKPLPAVQVDKKILIRRSQFDRWLEAHPIRPIAVDVGQIVDEVVTSLRVN
jgi:excisionase family DNA binding protein